MLLRSPLFTLEELWEMNGREESSSLRHGDIA